MVKHLSDRQKEILKILLNKKGFISTEKIADDLFLSKKTMRKHSLLQHWEGLSCLQAPCSVV